MEFLVNLPMPCVNAAVADHLVMLFGDMLDETPYEPHDRKGLFHIDVIFVAVVMEGDKAAIVVVNPGRGDNGPAQIAPDVFHGGSGVTFIRLCIDIETVFVFPVTAGLQLFEGRADFFFHFIQQGGAESFAEVCIVEVVDIAPETIIAVTTLGNEAVDVGVPL